MTCPIVKYVPHRQIEDHLRLGWILLADLGFPHRNWSVLMGWPCQCKLAEPVAAELAGAAGTREPERVAFMIHAATGER
jgi:hypothetical protein